MKRRPSWPLHVFFAHAGLRHRADIPECFSTLISQFNASVEFEFTLLLVMHVVGLRPFRADNVLDSATLRAELLTKPGTGDGIFFALRAYGTFSRARHSDPTGPRPVRDSTWQRQAPVGATRAGWG